MYALMFYHTSNASVAVLDFYQTKAAAMKQVRAAVKELKKFQAGTLVKDMKAGRVELRFRNGGGCAYYIEKAA